MGLVVPAIVLVAALAGCTAGPLEGEAAESPTPSSTPTGFPEIAPTPTPGSTQPPPPVETGEGGDGDGGQQITDFEPATLSLQPYYLYVLNAEGQVLESAWYADPPKQVALKIADALGVSATPIPDQWDPEANDFQWSGLLLDSQFTTPYLGRRYTLEVTAASINGVDIEVVNGWHVGSPAAPLEAQYDAYRDSGMLYIYVNTTPDSYNQMRLYSPDPYTTITKIEYPTGA